MRLLLQAPGTAGSQLPPVPPSGGGGGSNHVLAIALGVILGFFGITTVLLLAWLVFWRRRPTQVASAKDVTTSQDCDTEVSADWEIDMHDIKIVQHADGSDWVLGSGSFGTVLKGVRGDVQPVAMKVMRRADKHTEADFIREIAMMKFVSRDRNVVQFYGACVQPRSLLLVSELMESGDLRHCLSTDREGALGWYNRGKSIAIDIARGVSFLHSNKVIHRDLKSKNVLLSKEGLAKLADVGMACITGSNNRAPDNVQGTFAWAAPELLLGDRVTDRVDSFSFGVLLWEIVTGESPVRGSLRMPLVPQECPREVATLIEDCLQRQPMYRPPAKDICRRLYRAPPMWEEPPEVRLMLDESTLSLTEAEDVLSCTLNSDACLASGNTTKNDEAAEGKSTRLQEKPELQAVISQIRQKLDATRVQPAEKGRSEHPSPSPTRLRERLTQAAGLKAGQVTRPSPSIAAVQLVDQNTEARYGSVAAECASTDSVAGSSVYGRTSGKAEAFEGGERSVKFTNGAHGSPGAGAAVFAPLVTPTEQALAERGSYFTTGVVPGGGLSPPHPTMASFRAPLQRTAPPSVSSQSAAAAPPAGFPDDGSEEEGAEYGMHVNGGQNGDSFPYNPVEMRDGVGSLLEAASGRWGACFPLNLQMLDGLEGSQLGGSTGGGYVPDNHRRSSASSWGARISTDSFYSAQSTRPNSSDVAA